MNRVDQREWVLKLIYQDIISHTNDINKMIEENGLSEEEFVKGSINSYFSNISSIEEKLEENLDSRNKRLAKVLRAIIYLSLNEIYYLGVPVSVSINEAVNLAKKYSDKDDYKLINSILGSIVRKDGK